jgi:hypothetical protein
MRRSEIGADIVREQGLRFGVEVHAAHQLLGVRRRQQVGEARRLKARRRELRIECRAQGSDVCFRDGSRAVTPATRTKLRMSAISRSSRRAKAGIVKTRGCAAVAAVFQPVSAMWMSVEVSFAATFGLPASGGKMPGAPAPSGRWQSLQNCV